MENYAFYNALREVPKEAKREIQAGRLKGKTDINPMWRIKALTDLFGPCGVGWKYEIAREWMETGANGEVSAFVDINLYYKYEGEWSEAIPGTGGSAFVASERNGLYTSDECYKMALTDAISVACKALGMGADVYWEKDATKYDKPVNDIPVPVFCAECGGEVKEYLDSYGKVVTVKRHLGHTYKHFAKPLCVECAKKAKA